jgi:CRP/FNR family transcriptional regulator, anaerobic regulatory protein
MFNQLKNYHDAMLPMSEQDWVYFVSLLEVRHLAKGEVLVKEGEICQEIFFINKGAIRNYRLLDGKELVCRFSFENEYTTAYESFVKRTPSVEYLQTLEDSELIVITKKSMTALEELPYTIEFMRLMAEKLFFIIMSRTVNITTDLPEQRYERLLKEQPQVMKRAPQYMVASYLNITPETLSRVRKRITEKK